MKATEVSAETSKIHQEYGNVYNGTGCFKGIFSLKVKDDVKQYLVPPRYIAYTLQESFEMS